MVHPLVPIPAANTDVPFFPKKAAQPVDVLALVPAMTASVVLPSNLSLTSPALVSPPHSLP